MPARSRFGEGWEMAQLQKHSLKGCDTALDRLALLDEILPNE